MTPPKLPPYELHEPPLGEGLRGQVWLASSEADEDPLAIKIYRPEAVQIDYLRRVLEKLKESPHPHLAPVSDSRLFSTGPLYSVSPFYGRRQDDDPPQARSLAALRDTLRARELPRVLLQLAEALAHLHRHRLIHGDVRPSNIFLTDDTFPQVRVADYGQLLAPPVADVNLRLAPFYAPPEQWREPARIEGGVGFHWDVYSFGVVAYELLTGKLPRLQSLAASTQRASKPDADPSKVIPDRTFSPVRLAELTEQGGAVVWKENRLDNPRLRLIISHCLELAPGRRPANMEEVVTELKMAFQSQRVASGTRLVRIFIFILALGALAAAALGWWRVRFERAKKLNQWQTELAATKESDAVPAAIVRASRLELARKILSLDPQNASARETMVESLIELERYDDAAATLQKWEASDGPTAAPEELLGELAMAQKDPARALEHWQKAVALAGIDAGSRERILDRMAAVDLSENRVDAAVEALNQSIALADTPERRVQRAEALLRLRRYDEAEADIQKANEMDASLNEVKRALPSFEQLKKYLPQLQAIDAKIAANPRDAQALTLRAFFFYNIGQKEIALADAIAAQQSDASAVLPRLLEGYLLLDAAKVDEAAKLGVVNTSVRPAHDVWERLSALDVSAAAAPAAPVFARRAYELNLLGQYALAVQSADEALKLDPALLAAAREKIYGLTYLNKTKDALPLALEMTQRYPKDDTAWDYLGQLQRDLGDYPAAIASLSKSIALKPTATALAARENMYRILGKSREANQDLATLKSMKALDAVKP